MTNEITVFVIQSGSKSYFMIWTKNGHWNLSIILLSDNVRPWRRSVPSYLYSVWEVVLEEVVTVAVCQTCWWNKSKLSLDKASAAIFPGGAQQKATEEAYCITWSFPLWVACNTPPVPCKHHVSLLRPLASCSPHSKLEGKSPTTVNQNKMRHLSGRGGASGHWGVATSINWYALSRSNFEGNVPSPKHATASSTDTYDSEHQSGSIPSLMYIRLINDKSSYISRAD